MKKRNRFKRIPANVSMSDPVYIYVDTETGVNYLFVDRSTGGGLTPLLDKDGKPVITPIDKD